MTPGFAIKTVILAKSKDSNSLKEIIELPFAIKNCQTFYHSGCSSEGEYFGLLVPVVAEQPESGGPGVEIDHHLHQADVDQWHQHAHSQGQGALDSAGLGQTIWYGKYQQKEKFSPNPPV